MHKDMRPSYANCNSLPCDSGIQYKYRTCQVPKFRGVNDCQGSTQKDQACNTQACPSENIRCACFKSAALCMSIKLVNSLPLLICQGSRPSFGKPMMSGMPIWQIRTTIRASNSTSKTVCIISWSRELDEQSYLISGYDFQNTVGTTPVHGPGVGPGSSTTLMTLIGSKAR